MPDTVLPKPDPQAFDALMRAQAEALHAKDQPPKTPAEWHARRAVLRQAMRAAMGPPAEKPCPLEPRVMGVLKRQGYHIEKIIFQSRTDVWVTGSLYVPEQTRGR